MNLKQLMAGTACVVASLTMGSSVLAGEVTGNDKTTPVGRGETRAALCAYSGLEDFDGAQPVQPGVTQTQHENGSDPFVPGATRYCRVTTWGHNK